MLSKRILCLIVPAWMVACQVLAPTASSMEGEATEISAKNSCDKLSVGHVATLVQPGGNVDWSPDGSWIAFDAPDEAGWTDTWVARPDGSEKRCLTCDHAATPTNLHLGNPTWHPAQQWLVIQGVEESFFASFPSEDGAYKKRIMDVGVGIGNELFAVSVDGGRFVKLTHGVEENSFAHGVLHAHFSHDGHMLAWSQRIGNIRGNVDGEWVIKIANFVMLDEGPRMENVRTFQPGKGAARLYEVHSFSPDDTSLLFTANADGQAQRGYDIYLLDIASGAATRLTYTPFQWDEHAHFSPDGNCIVWMSSMNAGSNHKLLKTELWYMSADGSGQTQLTFFNDPNSWMYVPQPYGVIPADFSWSPRGDALLLYLIVNQSSQTEYSMPGIILLLELER